MGGNSSKSDSVADDKKDGQHKDKDDVFSDGPENGHSQDNVPLSKRRTSFYETVDASEVLPYLIIGNQASSRNEGFLTRKNVKYILNLTNESEEITNMEYKNIALEDDDDQDLLPYLEPSFEFINKAAKDWQTSSPQKHKDKDEGGGKATVLVHSYYGMSRSAAIVIAYLMKEKRMSLKDAYQHLKGRHSSINPNDNFVVQLIRYEQELFDGNISMTVKDFH